MDNISFSILANSGLFTFLSLRHGEALVAPSGRWKFGALVTFAFWMNLALMLDRFPLDEATYRAMHVSSSFIVLALVGASTGRKKQSNRKPSKATSC